MVVGKTSAETLLDGSSKRKKKANQVYQNIITSSQNKFSKNSFLEKKSKLKIAFQFDRVNFNKVWLTQAFRRTKYKKINKITLKIIEGIGNIIIICSHI